MQDKHIHIVSFDIPYPPNYGGVIDVFYKIKTLHELGIKVHLHCIEYPGRDRTKVLNQYCEEVHYYPRQMGIRSALSFKPYIVSSRKSGELLSNLLKDDHPVLFEGLHTCYYMDHPLLKNRFKIYRESNIEHRYYFNLFKVDRNIRNKAYFLCASAKLRLYQGVLKHADLMLAVSQKDTDYLQKHFPKKKVTHLPSFHANNELNILPGFGDYALYHGNIEVPENQHAAEYLIKEIFRDSKYRLIIAGMKPPERIRKLAEEHANVTLISNPDDDEMFDLIRNAHINILVTFQATGLKLKLLNTLYNGRFCLVNDAMLKGTSLNGLCYVGNTSEELRNILHGLFRKEFDSDQMKQREQILKENYDNRKNGRLLVELLP